MQQFEQIYAEHRDAVSAYVRRRSPEDAVDDIVSETCVTRGGQIVHEPTRAAAGADRPWQQDEPLERRILETAVIE